MGVRHLLAGRYEVEETETREDALELLTDVGHFDVAIVDVGPLTKPTGDPGSECEAIAALVRAQPGLGVVAYGERAERYLANRALDAGASAYVLKSSRTEELARAVDAAAESETFIDPAARSDSRTALTRRQREILQLFADGHSSVEVARMLGLSAETVKTHAKQIISRLGARDRTHAVALALRSSLID